MFDECGTVLTDSLFGNKSSVVIVNEAGDEEKQSVITAYLTDKLNTGEQVWPKK